MQYKKSYQKKINILFVLKVLKKINVLYQNEIIVYSLNY